MKKAGIFQEMINVEVVNWDKGLYEWQKKKKEREREKRDDWKGGIELSEVNEKNCQKGGAQISEIRESLKETANVLCDVTIPGILETSVKAVLGKH